jgi:glycosyltransferase involved in cell wall biosynthesis
MQNEVAAPLVSVIIPSYNHGRYLRQTLDSVIAQTYPAVELIVVDDGSTDDTAQVLAAYAHHVKPCRLMQNAGGPARPRNVGLNMAQGKYVAIFDSDDIMLPEKLSRQVSFLESYPDVSLVFSDFRNFDAEGCDKPFLSAGHEPFQQMAKARLPDGHYRIPSHNVYETLIADNFVGTSSIVFRKSIVGEIGVFDETLCNSDDIDFLFRVARKFDLGYIPQVLHERRVHPGNISSRPQALSARELVYKRLYKDYALSARAKRNLDEYLARIYYSRGRWERSYGSRKLSIKYFLKSWSVKKTNIRLMRSIIRSLLPR